MLTGPNDDRASALFGFVVPCFPSYIRNIPSVWFMRHSVVTKVNAAKHCKPAFGSHCEVYDEPNMTNSMEGRTHEAISLGPTGNMHESYKFFCIKIGKKLVRRKQTEMPMMQTIIEKVEEWGLKHRMNQG